jgi:hypothetical protein
VGSEAATLLGSLERMRATFDWKCAGLDRAGLARRLPSSELSLGRLLKHLAYMEDLNFTHGLGGQSLPQPWSAVDASVRSEWAFDSADRDTPEDLYRWWHEAVDRSRSATRSAVERGGPGATYDVRADQKCTVRRLLVDMIEE